MHSLQYIDVIGLELEPVFELELPYMNEFADYKIELEHMAITVTVIVTIIVIVTVIVTMSVIVTVEDCTAFEEKYS